MDKKDIYDHLAKIYLDASQTSKKQTQKSNAWKPPFLIGGFIILAALIFSIGLITHSETPPQNTEIALVINPDPVKINFNFNPAKKETFAINLNNLSMRNFRALDFSVKKAGIFNNISLRVEFTNIYNERSEMYFKNIPSRWEAHRVDLKSFRGISDWSCMRTLSFIVEEWNVKEKNGVVYIDNVRFLR